MEREKIHSTQFYFDLAAGQLLVGNTAYEAHIEAGGHPEDVRRLGEILLRPVRLVDPKTFPRMPYAEWNSADTVPTLRWLNSEVIQAEDPEACLTEEALRRTGYLGLTPRIRYFRSQPQGISGLYVEAQLSGVRSHGLSENWVTADYINFINGLIQRFGGKPPWEEFVASTREAGNPSLRQIQSYFEGGVPALYELVGFPNIKAWGYDDYIAWGVKFMLANDGRVPTTAPINYLSSIQRGPHTKSIYVNVGTMPEYQEAVREEYEFEKDRRKFVREQKLQDIENAVRDGVLSIQLLKEANSEDELIAIRARYIVAHHLLPHADVKDKLRCAVIKKPDWFVRAIQRINSHISAGSIEATALFLDVFDDIWPLDDYMQYLRVPSDVKNRLARKGRRKSA